MISVEKAYSLIMDTAEDWGERDQPLSECLGLILAEDLVADLDFPPFDRVAMDGIAIKHGAFAAGQREFLIESLAAAGSPLQKMKLDTNCMEVMTGCILPTNTDTVIRYEDLEIQNGKATIQIENITENQNIHNQAKDRQKGDLLIPSGTKIRSAEIGIAATIGRSTLLIKKMPKTAIISSGDELVDIDAKPELHQIRKSNVHQLSSVLSSEKIEATLFHIKDEKSTIKETLKTIVESFDIVILSGGVSMGKLDFIPEALAELNAVKVFHKISQRPGKPMWFGTKDSTRIFALPGNPISSYACMHKYILNYIASCLGQTTAQEKAILMEDVSFKPNLTYFLEAQIKMSKEGTLQAYPKKGNGSGDLANLARANAFIELPQGQNVYKAGSIFPVLRFK